MNFKKLLLSLVFVLAVPTFAKAHSVQLTYTKSTDDTGAAGQGYTAYRLSGACPSTAPTTTTGFTALNTTLFTGTTYTDTTVVPGQYCYILTFTSAAAQSVPSNDVAATILPAAPTNVTVTGAN